MLKLDRTYLNLILVVSTLTALYLLSQSWKNQLVVEKVKVYDAHILTDNEVRDLADIPAGSPLYKLSLLRIAQRVERNPFVDRAVVVRALPYDVTITVKEHDPIALVATPSSVFSIDRKGIILPLPMKRKNNMPVITNVQEQLQVGDTAKGTLMQAAEFINDARMLGPSLSANIAEVRIDGGNLIAYTTVSSLQIIIGENDFNRKLLYLKKFLNEVADGGDQDYRYVDLRFNGQIVVGTGSVNLNNQLAMLRAAGKGN
ncbi:MAG: FtsQ-type POTRA domain-containing protein [Bacteroidetes bacterium]|nr:FtsQ-type POTRA domain-containing protein [Bacteroidota bacterium]